MSIFDILILIGIFYIIHNFFGYGYINRRLDQAHREYQKKYKNSNSSINDYDLMNTDNEIVICPICGGTNVTKGIFVKEGKEYNYYCNKCCQITDIKEDDYEERRSYI